MNLSVVIVTLAAIIGIVAVVAILARIQQSDAASRAVPRDPMGIAARSRDVVNGSIGMYLLRRFTGRRPDPPAPPPLPPLSQTELEQRLGIGTWPIPSAPSTLIVSGDPLPVAAATTSSTAAPAPMPVLEPQPVFSGPFVLHPAPTRVQATTAPAVAAMSTTTMPAATMPVPMVSPARVPMPMATPVAVQSGPVVRRRGLPRFSFNIALLFLVVAAAAFAGLKVIPEVSGKIPPSPNQLAVIGPPTPEPPPSATPVVTPTPAPTPTPTVEPTASPSADPTPSPSPAPTAVPTEKPTARPTAVPTAVPTAKPTPKPTPKPSPVPKPIAYFTCSVSGYALDCNATGSQYGKTYAWDFGDGNGQGATSSKLAHHVYSNPGPPTYIVVLTVTNASGSKTAHLQFTVPQ